MQIEYLALNDISRLRKSVDPDGKWLSDEELRKILAISGCEINRAVTRCFIGIQQKARIKNDMDGVRWARIQQNRFDAGVLQI